VTQLIDSHCHLDDPGFAHDTTDALLRRANAAGVCGFVTISTRTSRYGTYVDLAERYKDYNVFFSIGTHPDAADEEEDITVQKLCTIAEHPRCVAIGESGLDYHNSRSSPQTQKTVFLRHIQASQETQLPLVIHARNADEDMIECLKEAMKRRTFPAILHCFSSGKELATLGVDLGCFVSFSGIITFKKSEALRDIASQVPLDRLLIETDAPFLSPEPYRGKINEPARVVHVCETLARVKGLSVQEMAEQTTNTFLRLFSKVKLL